MADGNKGEKSEKKSLFSKAGWLTIIFPLLIITFGTIGHGLTGEPFYPSLLESFKYLRFETSLVETNVFIEIARWLGFVLAYGVLCTFFLSGIKYVGSTVRTLKKAADPDAIALHGDDELVGALAKNLEKKGRTVITGDSPLSFEMTSQVLLFDKDADALAFLAKNERQMEKAKDIHIKLDEFVAEGMEDERILPFSLAQACAEDYWYRHPVLADEKIALIGSGAYAESLLTQGLLVNVYSVKGGTNYTVVGDFGTYRNMHPQLDKVAHVNVVGDAHAASGASTTAEGDSITFMDASWTNCIELFEDADRVIVCGAYAENPQIASQLLSLTCGEVHVLCADKSYERLFNVKFRGTNKNRVTLFGMKSSLLTSAFVMDERNHNNGKLHDVFYGLSTERCNACPRCKNHADWGEITQSSDDEQREAIRDNRLKALGDDMSGCLRCPLFLESWHEGMSGFLRRSNYAVAAHDAVKYRLLQERGFEVSEAMTLEQCSERYMELDNALRDELQEIEHIRWMRFHFMNNWEYADVRDNNRRRHPDLVPYAKLTGDKSKDADAYIGLGKILQAEGSFDEVRRLYATQDS